MAYKKNQSKIIFLMKAEKLSYWRVAWHDESGLFFHYKVNFNFCNELLSVNVSMVNENILVLKLNLSYLSSQSHLMCPRPSCFVPNPSKENTRITERTWLKVCSNMTISLCRISQFWMRNDSTDYKSCQYRVPILQLVLEKLSSSRCRALLSSPGP